MSFRLWVIPAVLFSVVTIAMGDPAGDFYFLAVFAALFLVLLPIGDVFGWRDRINEPATVNDGNWTFRLPWPVDSWTEIADARERQETLRRWAEQYGRLWF